jgi:hypothetical protein
LREFEASMKVGWQPIKWLEKKAKHGFRGYPIGTIAFYSPDDQRASKVVTSIFVAPDSDPEMKKWFTDNTGARKNLAILAEVVSFLREREVHSIKMMERIVGCPHEEIVHYPEGQHGPQCPYWKGRDRWAGTERG